MKRYHENCASCTCKEPAEPQPTDAVARPTERCGGTRKVWRASQGDMICVPCLGCTDCQPAERGK